MPRGQRSLTPRCHHDSEQSRLARCQNRETPLRPDTPAPMRNMAAAGIGRLPGANRRPIALALSAAEALVSDHAQRWRCTNIRPACLPARPWPGLPTLRKLLITERRAADRARRTVLGHGTLQGSSAHPRLRLRPRSGRERGTASWRGKGRRVPPDPNVSREGHRSRAIRRASLRCQGLNSFQCPSETTSTVPSITLTAVSSSIAYVGTGRRPAHFSAFATSW